jgi:hypothetical protein
MIRAGSGRTRMCGHRARSRGMCLLPIQESFHEDVSEHSAVEAFASAAHQSSHANPDGQCRNRAIPLIPTSPLTSAEIHGRPRPKPRYAVNESRRSHRVSRFERHAVFQPA